ncbi:MAG: PIN domain-containing protein [Planctomycetes bacterium]|nr:PIN domain-containing protein [Planctomycetota bacterium]
MDKTLLDTDILSEVLKGHDQRVVRRAREYRSKFTRYTLCTVNVLEVVKGFHKVGREDLINRFLDSIRGEEVLPLDLDAAVIAGRIFADLERRGLPIGRADPMIAGIALHHGLTLTTGNLDHYRRIQALSYPLKLDNWRS